MIENKIEVWILIIFHKYGGNVSVHSSLEKASNELYDYICQWWSDWDLPYDEENNHNIIPENKEEAIEKYFETTIDGEGWEILQRTIA